MTQNQTPVTTTDTLDKKIKKLIRKDMELNPANARK